MYHGNSARRKNVPEGRGFSSASIETVVSIEKPSGFVADIAANVGGRIGVLKRVAEVAGEILRSYACAPIMAALSPQSLSGGRNSRVCVRFAMSLSAARRKEFAGARRLRRPHCAHASDAPPPRGAARAYARLPRRTRPQGPPGRAFRPSARRCARWLMTAVLSPEKEKSSGASP